MDLNQSELSEVLIITDSSFLFFSDFVNYLNK